MEIQTCWSYTRTQVPVMPFPFLFHTDCVKFSNYSSLLISVALIFSHPPSSDGNMQLIFMGQGLYSYIFQLVLLIILYI